MSISCTIMGGLGNQLFQLFTTVAYAKEHSVKFYFEYYEKVGERPTYWKTLFRNFQPWLVPPSSSGHGKTIIYEQTFHYMKLPNMTVPSKWVLSGYFQSPKYFAHAYQEIRTKMGISDYQRAIRSSIPTINWSKTISMHFRWGDYKHLPRFHPLLPLSYYKNALHYLYDVYPECETVMYFCEEEDRLLIERTMVARLREEFPQLIFVPASPKWADWEQMLAMSCCQHQIIANSTFSWWGAYFCEAIDKHMVCYPTIWFGPAMSDKNTVDLFPETWICIGDAS